jgi:hypothetical protein
MPQAIASKLQVVGASTSASISEVKGLFPLKWITSVGIGNGLKSMLVEACKQVEEDLPSH